MRVLVVEPGDRGGMYSYSDGLSQGLSEAGADVTVLSSSGWPNLPRSFKVERGLLTIADKKWKSQLQWAFDRGWRCACNSFRRNRFALRNNFDIVHVNHGVPLFDQFLLRPLVKSVPVVLTIHDARQHFNSLKARESFLKRYYRHPHRVIVHHEEGKRQLVKSYGLCASKIDVVPHGIMALDNPVSKSEAREKLNLPSGRPILLFFGSIRANKGLEILLEALKSVTLSNPEVLLVVAGNVRRGMTFDCYSDIINRLDLAGNVKTFVKFIEDEDVDSYFAASDILVLPYKTFESQSGVLLRAYAHKKPVVVSELGAMGEIVNEDETGVTVEASNSEQLCDAIIKVLDNYDAFIAHYNSEIERKYSWESVGKITMDVYKRAIEQSQ